jgi:1-acyl-sn-glycerol-3-phosphate acyltransferase
MHSDPKPENPALSFTGTLWFHVRAALVLAYIACNLTFWIIPVLVLVVFKWLVPISSVQIGIYEMMAWIYRAAVQMNSWILFQGLKIQLDLTGINQSCAGDFYLAICNHQSWSDIFILQHLLNRKTPVMKFLVKKELIYLPVVGLICWAYDFPFLNRGKQSPKSSVKLDSKNDSQTLNKSLAQFLRSSATIMNFAEGTRFSPLKAKRQKSPYRHLLKPKAGGLIAIYKMMGQELAAVLDFTIVYDAPKPNFWRFIGGRIMRVKVHLDTVLSDELKETFGLPETNFTQARAIEWINQRWEQKDRKIEHIQSDFH